MEWLTALTALFPIINQLLKLFIKTPEEKREQLLLAILSFNANVTNALDEGSRTGDYGKLEDEINRRIGAR